MAGPLAIGGPMHNIDNSNILMTACQKTATHWNDAAQIGALGYVSGPVKRAMDIIFVALSLPLLVPLIIMLWLLVRCDGGPGFFGHRRIGANGQPFTCWKIRTMVPDAERQLTTWLKNRPQAAREWRQTYKLRHDPRVTRVGLFLRKTGLDELPQILNVLKGDMSLVGPRPVVADELRKYAAQRWVYHACRPGLTGLWQVTGRGAVSYADRVAMDRHYLAKASVWFDLYLLIGTAKTVVLARGC